MISVTHVKRGGIDQFVKLAHVRLCHSRVFFLVAYPRESQETVFDAHARAFAFFGGVPRRGIYDNGLVRRWCTYCAITSRDAWRTSIDRL